MRVLLTQVAQHDLNGAAAWFEGQRKGQGSQFLDRVAEGIAAIELGPLAYPEVAGENRRCFIAGFPYALWFKVAADVTVVGGLHEERKVAQAASHGVIPFPAP